MTQSERSPAPPSRASEVDGLSSAERPLVLYDGVCGLCNRWIKFVLRRDRKGVFRFAPLQSAAGQAILSRHGLPTKDLTTIVLVRGARIDCYSTAALQILRRLGGVWSMLYAFILVPSPVRDRIYEFVAVRRFRWFGRLDVCSLPSPEHRPRFIE